MLDELIQKIRQGDVQSFEDFYFRTYDTLYSYAWILTGGHRQKAQQMLIRTYCQVYTQRENIPEESQVYEWLYQTMDQTAIEWLEMTEEQIQNIKKEEENHETLVKLTEETAASVLLSIEELLELMEEREETFDRKKKIISLLNFCFACICFSLAVFAVCSGIEKMKNQIGILNQPLPKTLPPAETFYDAEGNLIADEEAQQEEKWIKVGDKVYHLSKVGEILYSLPLEESDWQDKTPYNDEIQETESWVYYLPSPEREDSKLANVSSKLVHTLYRMKKQDQTMEIVAEEVQDYTLDEDVIYVMQYGNIQKLEEQSSYQVMEDNLFAEAREDGIYLFNVFGNALPTDADGTLQIEDRIYKMKGNRIESVTPAECRKDDTSWYLKKQDGQNGSEIIQVKNGVETAFEQQGISIDSFCKAGDWIYYSAYIRKGGSGAHYSQIYRKPLSGGESELLRDDFSGKITQMYYNEEDEAIYAEYLPRSWDSGRGVIAVITRDGVLSTINNPAEREAAETTGHDNLSFVIVQDQDVLCYWNNRSWIQGEEPFVIWSKPLTLPNQSRTLVR